MDGELMLTTYRISSIPDSYHNTSSANDTVITAIVGAKSMAGRKHNVQRDKAPSSENNNTIILTFLPLLRSEKTPYRSLKPTYPGTPKLLLGRAPEVDPRGSVDES